MTTTPQTIIDVDANRKALEQRQRQQLHERIEHDFQYHQPPDEATRNKHAEINALLSHVAHIVADIAPLGREQAVAITKLEEARFWANAAIARNT